MVDAVGALLTAFFMFFVLRSFPQYVGMPDRVLAALAAIGACFSLYSAACFLLVKRNWKPFLRVMCCANALYVLLSLILLATYFPQIKTAGKAYFVMELCVISALVYIEFRVARDAAVDTLR
jgi:hypothetical protein